MKVLHGNRFQSALTAIMVGALLCALSGCSSSSSSKDNVAPSVSASPTSMIFTTSTVTVALTAMDNKKAAPTIHYTTDATIPTTASAVYTGPLTIGDDTVLRFFAVDKKGNQSEMMVEGYTRALFPIEEA